mmetsp:Transcript_14542/g.36567  ORF Transcript_14542/g.36567 Transcript_14542/m.36567 type:complete len:459 (+) Transcript_14542:663-2039(+)
MDDLLFEACGQGDIQLPLLLQSVDDLLKLQLSNLPNIRTRERAEDDHLVQAVEELRSEEALHLLVHQLLHLVVVGVNIVRCGLEAEAAATTRALLHRAAAQVGSHNDQRVGEGDRAAFCVGESAVVQNLQHHVEDVGVCLFHLVKENEGVGPPSHGLRQCAAIAVADIAGRGTDELRDGVLLHVLGHVQANHGILFAEVGSGQRLAEFGFADARGPAEDEGGDGAIRALESGAGPADGLRDRNHGLLLADDPLVQRVLERDEARRLVGRDLLHRNTGPSGDHLGDVVLRDDRPRQCLLDLLSSQGLRGRHLLALSRHPRRGGSRLRRSIPHDLLDLDGELVLLGLQLLGQHVILQLHSGLLLLLDLPQLSANLLGRLGNLRQLPELHPRACLVHDVDSLVRQEAVLDVLRGQLDATLEGLVREDQPVMGLVLAGETLEDLNGLLHCGFWNLDWLKAPL